MELFLDRKFRIPRVWSNKEIRKLATFFSGQAINVSGWKDEDKEGGHYKDYFEKVDEYYVSNHGSSFKGFQGKGGELQLDLEGELDGELEGRFDLVFNHTVLEHVFDFQKAFSNLCRMSREAVLVVVPFMQEQHAEAADYGDYWRFTPSAIKRMFVKNGYRLLYLNYNDCSKASIYIVALAVKEELADKWRNVVELEGNKTSVVDTHVIGKGTITNPPHLDLLRRLSNYLSR